MSRPIRRALRAAVLTVVLLGVAAPAAWAATVNVSGGTLTYVGTDDVNEAAFNETAPGTVEVNRGMDADPLTSASCTVLAAGDRYSCTGVSRVVATAGGGDDALNAGSLTTIPANMSGDLGADDVFSGGGADSLIGGPGDDVLDAGAGRDTLDGGDGEDVVYDAPGDDRAFGGPGDDDLVGGPGNDEHSGGSGYDTAGGNPPSSPAGSIVVTLDDRADDRLSGTAEADNVRTDIEAVDAQTLTVGSSVVSVNDTLVGDASANSLVGREGDDVLDGGLGNDLLNAGNGADTLRARDGFADFVACGPGADTAVVDTLDRVEDCENVQRADAGNANDVPEDRPPVLSFDAPASGARIATARPTTLTATATDDRGIAQVLFVDDERVVCADTTAPYTCDYQPRGEDVGRNTLAAFAVDTAQQTASTVRAVTVDRFAVSAITGAVTPARDQRAPYRFRTAGQLRLPATVSRALGCADGQVSIQVKAGSRTISTRRAELRRDCTFSSTVTFANRRRFTRTGRLRFTLRFTGNEVLDRSAAVARNVRTR